MRQDKFSRQNILLYCLGTIPVTWLALLIAPYMEGGLAGLIRNFGPAMENPFHIVLCADSGRVVAVLLLCYALAIGVYLSTQRNYRRREEHGSAKWGWAAQVNRKYADAHSTENKILTQNVAIGLDGRKHRRNLNTLVCGGSGAGKTRFFAKPNLCQANSSYVVLDPKGELLVSTGKLLEAKGYSIRVLDLINMDRSHCYNPFVYLRDDDDIQRLATNIMKNTTPKDSKSSDHFWEDMAAMLLKALISYLHYEAPPEEQNFPMVMDMIRAGDVKEDNEEYVSTLDELFEQLRGQGITDLSDVKYAVLETNGRLSVLPRSPLQPVTPEQLGLDVQDNVFLPIILINDGRVLTDNLRQAGRDDRWLAQELHRQGIARSQDVFLLSVDQHGTVVCLRKEAAR